MQGVRGRFSAVGFRWWSLSSLILRSIIILCFCWGVELLFSWHRIFRESWSHISRAVYFQVEVWIWQALFNALLMFRYMVR